MLLVVGRLTRPHGVRGDILCEVRTDEPEKRFVSGSVFVTDPESAGPLTIATARSYQGRMLLTLEGVDDRTAAEALRGVLLCVDSADVDVPSDPDEFADHQLVGLPVVDVDGHSVGVVARVEHAPAHDLLVVNRDGASAALVPFIRQIVPTVDVDGGRIVIDPPPGLLDL